VIHVRPAVQIAAATVLAVGGAVLFGVLLLSVLNEDLRGRATEIVSVPGVRVKSQGKSALVRLVVHRISPEENVVDASLILIVDGDQPLMTEVAAGKRKIFAEIRDASTIAPVELHSQVSLDAAAFRSGFSSAAVESEHFSLPASPSVNSYPFDDVQLFAIVSLYTDDREFVPFDVEVQRATPGRRLIATGHDGNLRITLTRTSIEKIYLLTAATIFFVLSIIVAAGLFLSQEGLSSLQELVAIAGYLVAAAGFRDLLGVSRLPSTSILEILILGIPLLALSLGVAVSMFRSRRQRTKAKAGDAA
jgi:hypothetical protein